ncbi:hypothetical protein GCM10009854_07450 [Saccharopolyspora halophila]|uniref:Uncharacterized protein n=1 Tax=Saccharopolyspora halophila TaxID=405551 RepID=A0ABN3FNT7_9PSEU
MAELGDVVRVPDQSEHRVTALRQQHAELSSDLSAGSGNRDSHAHMVCRKPELDRSSSPHTRPVDNSKSLWITPRGFPTQLTRPQAAPEQQR